MKRFLGILTLTLSGFMANAVPLANDMTCHQAQDYYAAHGRIWVQTRRGDVVPIWGDNRRCSMFEDRRAVWVRTVDTNRCAVAHRCFKRDND